MTPQAHSDATGASVPGALAGVRVVEVSQFEVGTVCGQQLAWLGADVVKVEQPRVGELGRKDPSFFAALNSSKRGVTIDLKAERGREVFLALVSRADVVIENLAPGTFERLRLGCDELQQVNPRLVFARAKAFGTWGDHASYKGFDFIAQATSGAMAATGLDGGPPVIERFPVADNATGIHLALGVMAALWQRQRTGRGQQVEAALQDTMLSMGRTWFSHHLSGIRAVERPGNRFFPGGDLDPCAGGGTYDHVYILCHPDRMGMWEGLFTTVGRPDLLDRYRHCDPATRFRDLGAEIDGAISAWTSTRGKFEAMSTLARAGVPAGAVLTADQVLADRHLRARDMVVTVEHPTHGRFTILGNPIKLSESTAVITPAPLQLGEHNGDVLAEIGYSDQQVTDLTRDGII